MNSATKEVSDSASSNDEPLSTIKTSLHHTGAKKYADYILQINESFKRKANDEALEELKVEKKQLKKGCWLKRKDNNHWWSSIKEATKHWKTKEKKE